MIVGNSLFQTEVMFNTVGPDGDKVRETCSDGKLPPRKTIFVGPSKDDKPDGMDEWIIENCEPKSEVFHLNRSDGWTNNTIYKLSRTQFTSSRTQRDEPIPDEKWKMLMNLDKFKELPEGEKGIKVECKTCEESPWVASADETEDNSFTFSEQEMLIGGVALTGIVLLGLLI